MNRLTVAIIILLSQAARAESTKVRIDFVEALAPRDTTSSVRFQKAYEETIELGKSLLKSKAAQCGYQLETKTTFYEASDAFKAKEIATQVASEGSWLIVGPRRSNHYLLLAQGAGQTPTISLMASADDVSKLDRTHTSLSPSNSEMALIAAKEAKASAGKHGTYMTVVSDDCTTCVDFSKAFDRAAARINLKKIGEIPVHGEKFDIEPIRVAALQKKPSLILLPNYSMVVARVLNAFNEVKNPPLFVGGDGWGDQQYGFVQTGAGIENISGIAVRGFPPVAQGLQTFSLGREANSKNSGIIFTGPDLAILKILEETTNALCSSRPKDRTKFVSSFSDVSSTRLHSPWGVSVYELKSGETKFRKTVGVR